MSYAIGVRPRQHSSVTQPIYATSGTVLLEMIAWKGRTRWVVCSYTTMGKRWRLAPLVLKQLLLRQLLTRWLFSSFLVDSVDGR
jgi:hypothetical protein